MPLPSYARVTNLDNGYSVIVRVNDRGPYAAGRVMDMSSRVADVLNFKRSGTAHVRVEYVGHAPLEGSDDDQLLATLRTDGGPADLGGATMTAQSGGIFGGLFGSPAPAPPPPPPPPPPVEAQAEEERPAPVAVAQKPPPPVREAPAPVAPRSDDAQDDAPAPRTFVAPLPPVRPYDLGAKQASVFPTPPVRHGSGDRALYFADPPRPHDDPLARVLRHKAALRDDE
jgi:rare lipoprotein A